MLNRGVRIEKKGKPIHYPACIRLGNLETFPIEQAWNVFLDVRGPTRDDNSVLNARLIMSMPKGSYIHRPTGEVVMRISATEFKDDAIFPARVISRLSPVHLLTQEMGALVPHVAFTYAWDAVSKYFYGDMDNVHVTLRDPNMFIDSLTLQQVQERHKVNIAHLPRNSKDNAWVEEAAWIFDCTLDDDPVGKVKSALDVIASKFNSHTFSKIMMGELAHA